MISVIFYSVSRFLLIVKKIANNGIDLCFDFDGTIVDSISIVGKIQQEILDKFEIKSNEEIEEKISQKIDEILQGENRKKIGAPIMIAIFKILGLNFFQRIRALIIASKTFKREAPKIALFEGAEELFNFLDEKSYSYAIITTSSNAEVADRLEIKYPDFYKKLQGKIIARDDVINLKPHPESIEKAAKLMGVSTKKCVMIGDMKSDIELGKVVGALTIGVVTGFLNKAQFEELGADYVLDSIVDIPQILNEIEEKVI